MSRNSSHLVCLFIFLFHRKLFFHHGFQKPAASSFHLFGLTNLHIGCMWSHIPRCSWRCIHVREASTMDGPIRTSLQGHQREAKAFPDFQTKCGTHRLFQCCQQQAVQARCEPICRSNQPRVHCFSKWVQGPYVFQHGYHFQIRERHRIAFYRGLEKERSCYTYQGPRPMRSALISCSQKHY